MVFIAGKERVVAEWAKLGFHAGTFPGMTAEQRGSIDKLIRETMVSAGVADKFIDRTLATPNDEMWYPSIEEMRLAGVITREDAPVKTFASNMASLLDNPTKSDGLKPTGHEEIDRFTKTFAEFSRRWGGLFVQMNADLQHAGEPNISSNQTFQEQEKLREGLSTQSKRKAIIEDYRSKAHEEVKWLTNEFVTMKFSESTTREMLKGMERSFLTAREQADQFLSLRLDVENAKEQLLRFLLLRFSGYKLANSRVSFSKQEDLEQYKLLAKTITDSSKALGEFESVILKSADAGKEQLKKLAQ